MRLFVYYNAASQTGFRYCAVVVFYHRIFPEDHCSFPKAVGSVEGLVGMKL